MAAREIDPEWEAFEAGVRLRELLDAAIQETVRQELEARSHLAPLGCHEKKKEVPFYKTK